MASSTLRFVGGRRRRVWKLNRLPGERPRQGWASACGPGTARARAAENTRLGSPTAKTRSNGLQGLRASERARQRLPDTRERALFTLRIILGSCADALHHHGPDTWSEYAVVV